MKLKKPKSHNLYVLIMHCIMLQELLNKCSRWLLFNLFFTLFLSQFSFFAIERTYRTNM